MNGKLVKSLTLGAVELSETSYPPNSRLKQHAHRDPYLCFVLDGSFTETCHHRSYLHGRSSLIVQPARNSHSDAFHARTRCLNVQFLEEGSEWHDYFRTRTDGRSQNFTFGPVAAPLSRMYAEFQINDAFSSVAVQGLALEALAALMRSSQDAVGKPPEWLVRAKQFLEEGYKTFESIDSLAKVVSVHPTHLAREFRKFFGCTIGEFIRGRRVQFACDSLANTDRALSQIALSAGFCDQSHFSTTFKLYTGLTPRSYRIKNRSRR